MAKHTNDSAGELTSFIGGFLIGLMLGIPLAVWLSPRSGREMRRAIQRRGAVVVNKAEAVARKPVEIAGQVQEKVGGQLNQLQEKVGQIKGESIEDALAEGKAIAAERTGKLANK